ncbi:hypothetical protein VU10_01320 [Desulfobulbus sp. US1]|nr:hypothetical protein [Desulfobulbus sp. US1]
MRDHLKAMIRKYRDIGVVFDTNLLLLLVVGLSERPVSKHKRLSAFVEEDFQLIKTIAEQFHTIAASFRGNRRGQQYYRIRRNILA